MSVDARERSRSLGQPAKLFQFSYMDVVHRFTDQEEAITIEQPGMGGVGLETATYTPLPIKRGGISASGAPEKSNLEVRLPETSVVADLFRGYPVSAIIYLTIREGHRGVDEWLVSWMGKVLGCTFTPPEAILDCQSASMSAKRLGLRRNYQYGCPHWLYGPQCRADREAATATSEIVSATGARLLVADGFNTAPLPKYIGGIAEWTDAQGRVALRSIIRAEEQGDGTVLLSLNGSTLGAVTGQPVSLSLGCDHSMNDCRTLHRPVGVEEPGAGGNIHNYGGQPFIPTNNPIGIVNQYY